MRAAAVATLAAMACASTPPTTSTALETNGVGPVRPRAPEPPPPPPLPPPERAERIVEAQLSIDRASVTDLFGPVEGDARSSDGDRARAALQTIQAIALRAAQMREPHRYQISVVGDGLEPLLVRIEQVLAQLAYLRDCPMYLAVEGAAGQMAFVARGRDMAKGMLIEPGYPMSKRAVVCGMEAIKPKVMACYAQYQVPGTAIVNVAIDKQGTVTAATASGTFAGTPTGNCVEAALRTATFPPSDGMNTPYLFKLQ